MLILLLACWRPSAYVPPEPPPEAVAAMTEEPAEEKAEAEKGDEKAEPEEEKPEEEEKPAMEPYLGKILTSPATLVDDFGRPVLVIEKAQTQVEVRAEEDIRKKVYCGACVPAGEGWIQANLVERL